MICLWVKNIAYCCYLFVLLVEKVLETARLEISAPNHLCCKKHGARVFLKYSLKLSEAYWCIIMKNLKTNQILVNVVLKSSCVAVRQNRSQWKHLEKVLLFVKQNRGLAHATSCFAKFEYHCQGTLPPFFPLKYCSYKLRKKF